MFVDQFARLKPEVTARSATIGHKAWINEKLDRSPEIGHRAWIDKKLSRHLHVL